MDEDAFDWLVAILECQLVSRGWQFPDGTRNTIADALAHIQIHWCERFDDAVYELPNMVELAWEHELACPALVFSWENDDTAAVVAWCPDELTKLVERIVQNIPE